MEHYKINEQQWNIDIFIQNSDYKYQLNWNVIRELTLSSDLLEWTIEGNIIIMDTLNVFERLFDSPDKMTFSNINTNEKDVLRSQPYLFKNDNTDILHIYLRPDFNKDDSSIPELPIDENWTIKGEFVVYDKTEANSKSDDRIKCLKFCDKDRILMRELRPQWSTATSSLNTQITNQNEATDDERSMFTGLALKSLLIDNGFKVDEDNWDNGSTKIFYSTYGNSTLEDSIQYILTQHLGEKNKDVCFLHKDYVSGKYRLLSLSAFFNNAGSSYTQPGKWQIEHFYFGNTSDGRTLPSPYKSPVSKNKGPNNDTWMNSIDSYQYIDAVPEAATTINIPQIIVAHNPQKQFIIDASATSDNVDSVISNRFIPRFYTDGGKPITKYKQNAVDFRNRNFIFNPYSENNSRERSGLAKSVYNKLFTSGGVIVQSKGMPSRRVGTFMALDRNGFSDNDYDYKLCGQWFITTILHKFKSDDYNNKLMAVKIHSFTELGKDKINFVSQFIKHSDYY